MIQTEKGEAGCKRHKMALSRGNCGKLKLTNLQLKLNSFLVVWQIFAWYGSKRRPTKWGQATAIYSKLTV